MGSWTSVAVSSDDASALIVAVNQHASALSALISQAAVFSGTVTITGATVLSGALDVSGATALSSTLTVTSGTTLSSTLTVTSGAVLSSTLAVTSSVTLSSTLGVVSDVTLSGDLTVASDILGSGTLRIQSGATLSSTLVVTSGAVFSSTLTATSAVTFSANLVVAGSVVISGTLDVGGLIGFVDLGVSGVLSHTGSAVGFFSVGALSQFSAISSLDLSALSAGAGLATASAFASGIDEAVVTTTFLSPGAATGTFYYLGFYGFGASDHALAASLTFGDVNAARHGHPFVVTGQSAASDVPIIVSGTTIVNGVTSAGVTETITVPAGSPSNTYVEATKHFVGQFTFHSTGAASGLLYNYGIAKYWDMGNTDFTVKTVEAIWLAGANDTAADIILRHHQASGWTFNAGGEPTPPPPITSMRSAMGTHVNISNGVEGCWKGESVSVFVQAATSEGIFWQVSTGANGAFDVGQAIVIVDTTATHASSLHMLGRTVNALGSAMAGYGFTSGN